MDAVNPDYLAVRLLHRGTEPIGAWLLPGNYLFGRAPILIAFYHGSLTTWFGLPVFWLFGTTVTGLRITHALFGFAVLASLYALLARGGAKPWQAALACGALALDPGFTYAFRTQSYITLAPAALLFLSLYSLQRAADSAVRNRWLFFAGWSYGLAVVGYFIYAFFLPALVMAALWWTPAGVRRGRGLLIAARRSRAGRGVLSSGVRAGRVQPRRPPAGVGVLPADATRAQRVQRAARPRHALRAHGGADRVRLPELVSPHADLRRARGSPGQRLQDGAAARRAAAPVAPRRVAARVAGPAARAHRVRRVVRRDRAAVRHAAVRPSLHGAAAARVRRVRAGARRRSRARRGSGVRRPPRSRCRSPRSSRSTSAAR